MSAIRTRVTVAVCLVQWCSIIACVVTQVTGQVPFGSATKGVLVTSKEVTILSHATSRNDVSGVVSSVFIESADLLWAKYDDMRLKVYVDGEKVPSVDVNMVSGCACICERVSLCVSCACP
jgi:hypothetical protein